MSEIPLPDELSGVEIERIITLDSALMFIIGGALSWLVDSQKYERTGTLSEETVRELLETMLEGFYNSQ
jgi:hypothetical protein